MVIVMRCGKARQWISAKLDGELDAARRQLLEAHLADCAQCRAFAAELAGLDGSLDLLSAPEPPEGFTGRVLSELGNEQPVAAAAGGWHEFLRPAPLGLSAAAFVLGVLLATLAGTELQANGANGDAGTTAQAGGYFTTLSADAVEERLLTLLPETEE